MTTADPKAPKAAEAASPKTLTSQIPETPTPPERKSIFDTSYAAEGAERRKAWSRFDRKPE